MLYLALRIARAETEADKREFVQGVLGTDKASIKSLAAGVLAATLLKSKK